MTRMKSFAAALAVAASLAGGLALAQPASSGTGVRPIGHSQVCQGSNGWFITWHAWNGTYANVSTPQPGSYAANYTASSLGYNPGYSWGSASRYAGALNHEVDKTGYGDGNQDAGHYWCY